MSFWSRVCYLRPDVTSPAVIERLLVKARLQKKGLTVTRLATLSLDQRMMIMGLAERIRKAAGFDRMKLITPSLKVLETMADFLINRKIRVDEIPQSVFVSMARSKAVNLGEQTLDFGRLDTTMLQNFVSENRPVEKAG